MKADAAAEAKDGLDDERWFEQSAVGEIGDVIKMPDVVAFAFEPGAVPANFAQRVFDHVFSVDIGAISRTLE